MGVSIGLQEPVTVAIVNVTNGETLACRDTKQLLSKKAQHHLVKLKSVEDDDLGSELEVIWELEIDAATYETRELPFPEGFDSADRLDAFLDAVRWGAVSSADVRNVQSPFRSGIDLEDYQLDPVVRAIQMPRVS